MKAKNVWQVKTTEKAKLKGKLKFYPWYVKTYKYNNGILFLPHA